ncbi:MAG: EamA family transporter [Clostridia bacterium]|nr:EamA family transporter [Clostridia bacterium]
MIYLLLAIFSSAMVSIVMRLSTGRVKEGMGMLSMNYLCCLFLSLAYTGVSNAFPALEGLGRTIFMGSINGVLYLLGFVLLQVNVRKNGVVLSGVFMKLGLLVPMVMSVLLFAEMPSLIQTVGFLLAVGAIVLINYEKDDKNSRFGFGLILLLLAGGSGDAMSKVFNEIGAPALSDQFLLYTFFSAFLLCTAMTVVKKEKIGLKEVLFGFLIGIPNFFSAKFLLKALESISAVIVYPTYSVATLLVITLAGVLFFKEKLKYRRWAALGVILVSLVLLNI